MANLDDLRKRIDEIDRTLTSLLNDRARLAQEIGKLKKEFGLDAYSPEREEEIIRNVTGANPGPLTEQALRRLFERIIDESRSAERAAMDRHPSKL